MATQDYLDFELNVEALDNNRLRVTVSNSPVGSVSIDLANPFTSDEISRVIGLLEGSVQAPRAELSQSIRAFGEKLFNTVFSGQVYAAYLASQERAGAAGLRIRLGLEDAGPLQDLPWELLRDPRNDYLVLSRQTPIVRYPRVLTVRPLVEIKLPLRVLVMISSPADQDKLDVEGEWNALQESTADLRSRGLLEIERLPDAQLVTLQRKLRDGTNYQIFHFIGHSAFDDHSQTGMLAFEDPKSQKTVPVSGEALARELSEENSIRLVVMNACQGARENKSDPFAGIASSIVARGVPAVVAMQFTISDDASRLFSQEFYRALSEGYPIEAAVAEARRSMSSGLNNFEWATPVLYLRAPSGVLFPRQQGARVSAGGVQEALRSPLGVIASLVTLAIIVGGVYLFTQIKLPTPSTATPTPAVAPDVDLVVTSLKFSPPNPVPGQHVTVAMSIKNNGTTDSGQFKWEWFAKNFQENPPSIVSEVANLGPGASLNVKGDFYFGLWGTYITTAFVNPDNQVPETNFLNNLLQRPAITADDPLVVDFTRLPNGDSILDPLPVKGDEFSAWGFTIAPGAGADTTCKDAIVLLNVQDAFNELVTARAGHTDQCTNLPIIFSLDQEVGSASVQFTASTPGIYTLELFDGLDNKLQANSLDVAAGKQTLTIRAPKGDTALANVRKAVFSGPPTSSVAIESITFTLPSATATP